ncbi:NAD(P)/FAD-dependent oxidoreductase [Thermoactinomyces sp. CICC 10522]|uniref:FAD-dependent oxidoreductase n=1 Tax=Thermoactinomyces sp. CICC 10522 TaxID=2767427 RepID=UPI0018DE48CD|nr:NAD(P)/FAD-dependent oxidoreductase [Thermoactinomyces sp. CICC 10522]MBH8605185.1 FAD-dependent monooxygenase [Thermoactinomyces sp. CICC 10522]
MTLQEKSIAIIGGGPGGLMLALILQRNGIKATIYEREPDDKNMERGGSLDIHEDTGQLVLKEAGVYEQFLSKARFEGEDFRLFDKTGKIYLDEDADEEYGARPEIDRGELCALLLNALDKECIQYGYKLDKCIPLENGKTELHFENGQIEIADLVIGADGAFSRVRPILASEDISYSGLTMLEMNVVNAAVNHPDLASFHKRGTVFALDEGKGIIGQLNGNGTIKVYVGLKVNRDWLDRCGIPFNKPKKAKEAILDLFGDWDEQLKNYIRYAEDTIIPRRIYMLPVGFKWQRHPRITLIGDAAHLMSPFAGEGVNLAMFDAYHLALAIMDNQNNVSKAIEIYEEKMFAYSSEAAAESKANLELCFGDHAAERLMNVMNSYKNKI